MLRASLGGCLVAVDDTVFFGGRPLGFLGAGSASSAGLPRRGSFVKDAGLLFFVGEAFVLRF